MSKIDARGGNEPFPAAGCSNRRNGGKGLIASPLLPHIDTAELKHMAVVVADGVYGLPLYRGVLEVPCPAAEAKSAMAA